MRSGFHLSANHFRMRAALALLVVALIAGCGYKGPLYLPKPKPEPQATPAPPMPDTEKTRKSP